MKILLKINHKNLLKFPSELFFVIFFTILFYTFFSNICIFLNLKLLHLFIKIIIHIIILFKLN